jgi:hypothetical protein
MRLRLPVVRRELHHETDGSERIEHEDRVLSRGRISACVHKRHSEQSGAGMTDECFGVAAVGLEHLERLGPQCAEVEDEGCRYTLSTSATRAGPSSSIQSISSP